MVFKSTASWVKRVSFWDIRNDLQCDSKDNTNAPIMGIVVNNSNIATDATHTEPALNTSMSINYF